MWWGWGGDSSDNKYPPYFVRMLIYIHINTDFNFISKALPLGCIALHLTGIGCEDRKCEKMKF